MIRRLDLRGRALDARELRGTLPRAEQDVESALEVVRPIVEDVRARGAAALRDLGARLDGVRPPHLRVPADALADALAARVEQAHGVRSARGSVVEERGRLVAEVRAVVEPWADLRVVARGSDDAAAELHRAGGRDDLRPRVRLRVARTEREPSRSVA
ncbi:histidinol dehydrogenase [Pseudokineococcus marinus]|uniref:Uncharacterized protein n=1 Tax=Pseudokineococcus marinus TaxID=351215 RepID=A0A849BQG7_9ACTN|nr:histidinol dehydrogenase [Pseudokineococcus marinus]NNH23623.1 hypothetical protein [Pseudokineococcus marinus]